MITVYSKPGCPKCRVLKLKLDKKNLAYEECQDVEKMTAMGLKSLPVMDVDGERFTFENAVKYINER